MWGRDASVRATAALLTSCRVARSSARRGLRPAQAAARARDRRCRTRLRARTRRPRGQAVRCGPAMRSQAPARMQRDDAARKDLMGHTRKSRFVDHFRERLGLRKLADRFDEVAIGFGVAGYGLADLRNDVE